MVTLIVYNVIVRVVLVIHYSLLLLLLKSVRVHFVPGKIAITLEEVASSRLHFASLAHLLHSFDMLILAIGPRKQKLGVLP